MTACCRFPLLFSTQNEGEKEEKERDETAKKRQTGRHTVKKGVFSFSWKPKSHNERRERERKDGGRGGERKEGRENLLSHTFPFVIGSSSPLSFPF